MRDSHFTVLHAFRPENKHQKKVTSVDLAFSQHFLLTKKAAKSNSLLPMALRVSKHFSFSSVLHEGSTHVTFLKKHEQRIDKYPLQSFSTASKRQAKTVDD